MSNSQNSKIYKNDLDLDLMTLVLNLDLDMVNMSHPTKNEVSMSRHSKVVACTDTQRQYENNYLSAYAVGNRHLYLYLSCNGGQAAISLCRIP